MEQAVKSLLLILIPVFLFTNLLCTQPDTVKGEFTLCKRFEYRIENGKVDENLRFLRSFSKYNNSGNLIEDIALIPFEVMLIKDVIKYDKEGKIILKEDFISIDFRHLLVNGDKLKNGLQAQLSENLIEKFHDIVEYRKDNTTEYEYDENGRLIKSVEFDNWLILEDKSYFISKECEYEYDNNGRLFKEKRIDYTDTNNILVEYEYDKNGNKIKEELFDIDKDILIYKMTWVYDKDDKMIEKLYFHSEDSLLDKEMYEYDENRNKIKMIKYNENDLLDNIYTYKYDKKGNLINEEGFNAEGELIKRTEYKHDSYGNIIEMLEYKIQNELISKYIYEYSK